MSCAGGLTTREIARAFLSSEPTVAQRIVRAKKTLRERNVAYRVPTVRLYDALLARIPSPIVALNRALAGARSEGAERGLALVEQLAGDERLRDYPWLPSARADLLRQLGRAGEAAAAYREAIQRTSNLAERAALARRLSECEAAAGSSCA